MILITVYSVADPGGGAPGAPPPPYFRKGKKKLKYLSFANSEGGPKRLKSDSCEAESCFPGYRIIETTANVSDLFEAIAHQLVAGTYNIQVSAVTRLPFRVFFSTSAVASGCQVVVYGCY